MDGSGPPETGQRVCRLTRAIQVLPTTGAAIHLGPDRRAMLELRPPARGRKRGGAQRRNMKPQIAFAFLASFLFAEVARAQFSATPLTDMGTALYLGAFPGMLYQG